MRRDIRQQWQRLQRDIGASADMRVRLLGSFTIDRLAPYLGVDLVAGDRKVSVEVGAYNQVVQECLDARSPTRTSETDFLVVWSRLEQLWRGMPAPLSPPTDPYVEPLREVAAAAVEAAQAMSATRLVFVLPAVPRIRPLGVGDHRNPHGVAATAAVAREEVRAFLAAAPGALVVDAEDAVRQIGVAAALDPRLEYLADIPYTEELLEVVAGQIAGCIRLTSKAAPKVLALDADGTLWSGEAADPESIELDGPAAKATFEFQRLLLDVRRAGALLVLCSKNIEEDVRAALEMPGMPLSWDDFSAARVGWDSKSESLREIAAELNLGLADFVFIDDNPAEIMEVQTMLPQVRTVLLPDDPTAWPRHTPLMQVLDRMPPTDDDLRRPERYTAERERKSVAAAVSKDEYRARLAPEVRVFEPASTDLARFAQLLQRTNQFRLNKARFDQSELGSAAEDGEAILRLLEAWDSFGDYGIVGGAVLRHDGDCAQLLAFAVSCRALGRGIEEAFLAELGRLARERWDTDLVATLDDTGRNEPAMRFFRAKGVEVPGTPAKLENLVWPDYVKARDAE